MGRLAASTSTTEDDSDQAGLMEVVDFGQVVRATSSSVPPLPGDRFDPLGMGGQTMPLADFLRGQRVPREQRGRTPLVCDQPGNHLGWQGIGLPSG